MTRICVTGGRNFEDTDVIHRILGVLSPSHIGMGDCPTGVDKIVMNWSIEHKCAFNVFIAQWGSQGQSAGPLRNLRMLRDTKPEFLLAFPGGRGTESCIRFAQELGIPVLRVLGEEEIIKPERN